MQSIEKDYLMEPYRSHEHIHYVECNRQEQGGKQTGYLAILSGRRTSIFTGMPIHNKLKSF